MKVYITISIIAVAFVAGSMLSGSSVFADDKLQKNINNPFKTIWNAIEELQAQINSIQLTPGPQGPIGLTGPQGPKGDSGSTKTIHLNAGICETSGDRAGITMSIGWCPGSGFSNEFWFIEDSDVKETSVIAVTLDYPDGTYGRSCAITHLLEGEGFVLRCSGDNFGEIPVSVGTSLNYSILNS
ncbi:hypothetical protein YTPLAS73_11200 [Nitrosarchaeum sp.]|nr:hypothetical protein YTPLAS73_11200 [Nitrosarchaeum sp.]